MKNIFFISVIILLFFSTCKKKEVAGNDPSVTPHAHYDSLALSILPFKFKVGSYWVYKNDSTAILDSIIIDSISTGFIITTPSVHGTTDPILSQFYKMYIHDFGSSKYYNECLIENHLVRNFGGDFSHFLGQLIYISNDSIGTSAEGMAITAKFPNMIVNSNNFYYVDEVKITAANQYQPEFSNDTYLYYSDSIGLIRKETFLSSSNIESWSIKRWHVIK